MVTSCGHEPIDPHADDLAAGRLPLDSPEVTVEYLLEAVTHDRPARFFYLLSYKMRDAVTYEQFVERWPQVRAAILGPMTGPVEGMAQTYPFGGPSPSPPPEHLAVYWDVGGSSERVLGVLVREYDPLRWPGELDAVWRLTSPDLLPEGHTVPTQPEEMDWLAALLTAEAE